MDIFLFEFLSMQGGVDISIKYSYVTMKYYVACNAHIKEGGMLHGVCEHEDTIEQAIESFNNAIKGKTLIFNHGRDNQYEISIPKQIKR